LLELGRDITGNFTSAESREWLCTSGIGGFASATTAGSLARRYHSLLVAALAPPLGRTLLATKLDESLRDGSVTWELGANRWQSGMVAPHGYRLIECFYSKPERGSGLMRALTPSSTCSTPPPETMRPSGRTRSSRCRFPRARSPRSVSAVSSTSARDICSHPSGSEASIRATPDYQGHCEGGPSERDGAYHQGTVWGWLLGPFALAHFKINGDRQAALAFLEPLGRHIGAYGVGSLGEVFDGEPPHLPRGCPFQAWTVAETLRAWTELGPRGRSG